MAAVDQLVELLPIDSTVSSLWPGFHWPSVKSPSDKRPNPPCCRGSPGSVKKGIQHKTRVDHDPLWSMDVMLMLLSAVMLQCCNQKQ